MVTDITDGWSDAFDDFVGLFAGRFGRVEPRRRMVSYLRGLLGERERKNGWTLAEAAGDAGPQGMQRLLNHYVWDADLVRDDVRDAVVRHLGDPERGILVLDETRFPKKGIRSAGVSRQYSAAAGRMQNSQIGVFLAYASDRGCALIDRELYVPKDWFLDRERCRAADIGDDVAFASRDDLGVRMLERAVGAGVPFGWVAADGRAGRTARVRSWLEDHEIPYVVAVPSARTLVTMEFFRQAHPRELVADVPDAAWRRVGHGDGVPAGRSGPGAYDWAMVSIRPGRQAGWAHRLLARRDPSDRTDIACFICFCPAGTVLTELVRAAGARRTAGACLRTARSETGLDHYQVRGYTAWYRHITLSMAALAFLVASRTGVDRERDGVCRARVPG